MIELWQTPRFAASILRHALAQEAARVMAEHGIRDFLVAKRKAAERFGVTDGSAAAAATPKSKWRWPNTSACSAGGSHAQSLHAQRRAALQAMRELSGFEPRLVGPVLERHRHRSTPRCSCTCLRTAPRRDDWLLDQGIRHEVTERRVKMNAERVTVSGGALRGRRPAASRPPCFRPTASARRRSARSTASRCGAPTPPSSRRCSPLGARPTAHRGISPWEHI